MFFKTVFSNAELRGGLESTDLDNIKTQLDLVLLALEALTGLGSEAILQAAADLKLVDFVSDRVGLWRLRQSNPLRRGSGGRKKLDIEEARSLVLISNHLARQHQAQIRQAIEHWESIELAGTPPEQDPLLADYLDAFTTFYQERMHEPEMDSQDMGQLALNLLIDLLFYSSPQGSRHLWLALLDRSGPESIAEPAAEPRFGFAPEPMPEVAVNPEAEPTAEPGFEANLEQDLQP